MSTHGGSLQETQKYVQGALAFAEKVSEMNKNIEKRMGALDATVDTIKMTRIQKLYNGYVEYFEGLNKTIKAAAEQWADNMDKQAKVREQAQIGNEDVAAMKKAASALRSIDYIKAEENKKAYTGLDEKFLDKEKIELRDNVKALLNYGINFFQADLQPVFKKAQTKNTETFFKKLSKDIYKILETVVDTTKDAIGNLVELQETLKAIQEIAITDEGSVDRGMNEMEGKKAGLRHRAN